MSNHILKTLAYDKQARILFVENTQLVHHICQQAKMNKLLKSALCQTLSIASLSSGFLKDNQRMSIKVKASNRNYAIFADVDSTGNVRGYVSDELLNAPQEVINRITIEQLFGKSGCIQVIKDIGMNNTFTGITDMPYGNIVDDFSHYFRQSEQTPSFFSTAVVFDEKNEPILSRGIAAQLLPGAPISILHHIRKTIFNQKQRWESQKSGQAFADLPHSLFENIDMLSDESIQMYCECSKSLFYPMLYTLGKEELQTACDNEHSIEFVCNNCGKKYTFLPAEISNLF